MAVNIKPHFSKWWQDDHFWCRRRHAAVPEAGTPDLQGIYRDPCWDQWWIGRREDKGSLYHPQPRGGKYSHRFYFDNPVLLPEAGSTSSISIPMKKCVHWQHLDADASFQQSFRGRRLHSLASRAFNWSLVLPLTACQISPPCFLLHFLGIQQEVTPWAPKAAELSPAVGFWSPQMCLGLGGCGGYIPYLWEKGQKPLPNIQLRQADPPTQIWVNSAHWAVKGFKAMVGCGL